MGLLKSIKVDSFDVMTEGNFNSIEVVQVKGICLIDVKGGKINLKNNAPPEEFKKKILSKIEGLSDGKYQMFYDVMKVNGQETITAEVELRKSKLSVLLNGN
jgi:hypothetical protein